MNDCIWFWVCACNADECHDCKQYISISCEMGKQMREAYQRDIDKALEPVREECAKSGRRRWGRTMPTTDERREVAARLREKHYERQGTFEPQSISIQAMNRMDDLLDCLPKRRDMFLDLADLIEPEPERTCRNEFGRCFAFECSECGVNVEGGDMLGHNSSEGAFNFCPNCGAKVVGE